MKALMDRIGERLVNEKCSRHGMRAKVIFRKLKFEFDIKACCKPFKSKINTICQREKLAYLQDQHSRISK